MEALYDYAEPTVRTALNRLCEMQFVDVPAMLEPYVDSILANHPLPTVEGLSVRRVPEAIVHVVCDILDYSRAGSETFVNEARLVVSGPHTSIHPMPWDVREIIVAQLRPGAARALLGIPCEELTGRMVSLEDIWGKAAKSMLEEVAAQRTTSARIGAFTQLLCSRLDARPDDRFVVQAAEAIRCMGPGLGANEMAAKLGYTERHLRRLFSENLGLSPKSFARVTRLGSVLRSLRPDVTWAEIAMSHGFSDQSHLIREFREFLDVTPTNFARNRPLLELLKLGVIACPK